MNELNENQKRVAHKIYLMARDIATIDGIKDGEVSLSITIVNGEPVDVAESEKVDAIARAQSAPAEW